ncbi:MAG: sugar-binding domain-containing protein [Sphingobacteriaceae bacterium]
MKLKSLVLIFLGIALIETSLFAQTKVLPLEGVWNFKLDPFETGINSNGVQLLPQLVETITLPGSTDKANKGLQTQTMTSIRLTRAFEYKGIAWYEKEIFVPADWKNKEVELFLERAHWETRVWINKKPAGRQESLSTPHTYSVSSLIEPGKKNKIRIRVNNEKIYDLEYAHAISAETQTNWNGIIGKMELQAFDKAYISDIQVYPDAAKKSAKAKVTIKNASKKQLEGNLLFSGKLIGKEFQIPAHSLKFSGKDSILVLTADIPLGADIQLWDEFNPALYQLNASLTIDGDAKSSKSVSFGIRDLKTKGTQFIFNGRPSFIRGTVNCAEFPLTGYPPTDLKEWLRIFQTCKDYGLNAMRFHTWCPPEAAFVAADQLGIYLQVENPDWRFTVGKDTAVNRFLKEEAERILDTYGNHPSFIMFCEGNEMVGPKVKEFLSSQVKHWKEYDPRRLYTGSAAYPLVAENEYHVLYGARPHRWKEGLKSRFNVKPLDTKYDYSDYVVKHKEPIITHEIGQWCVFPDFNEIPKYTGVLKPYNYELFRELLRDSKMLDQAQEFTMASGKFSVIMKKEEVESYLRTPGFGGYHMLQLNDFPGQGTAPVGVVDIFWDPKPYVTAAEFSKFQSTGVPLLRTESFTWTNDQMFKATAQFANFGESSMPTAVAHWSLKHPDGRVFAEGDFASANIPVGSPFTLGELSVPLNNISKATKLDLEISVKGTDYSNSWGVWVYPKQLPAVASKGLMVALNWDNKVKRHLENGGKVLLLADTAKIQSTAEPVFSGISWNTVWSGMPPNLLGILCNPEHPALKHFPTEYHSNWQWWDVVRNSKPIVINHTPFSFKPLVQMVPDWNRPDKIGLVFEAKVGKGSLLLTSVNLRDNLDKRPVARQFLYSLKEYAGSKDFSPSEELTTEMIDAIFKK